MCLSCCCAARLMPAGPAGEPQMADAENLHKVRRLEWILLPVCVDVLFSVVVSCLLVRAERLHMVGRLVFIKARGEVL